MDRRSPMRDEGAAREAMAPFLEVHGCRVIPADGADEAAIDIAVYDALGKATGLSVSALLGGALTDRVPSHRATGVGMPADVARLAAEKVAEGYRRSTAVTRRTAGEIEEVHRLASQWPPRSSPPTGKHGETHLRSPFPRICP